MLSSTPIQDHTRIRRTARVRAVARWACSLVGAAALLGAGAPPAAAGPPGTWTRVTDTNGVNIDEVGLARTADGSLHVVWPARLGVLNEAVKHASVSPGGKLGPVTTGPQGFSDVSNPDVVVTPGGGLQMFFGGLGSSDPQNGIQSATSDATGAAWNFLGKVSNERYVSGVGAAVRPDGLPVFAWYRSFEIATHVGTNPADSDTKFPSASCCQYDPGLAVDAVTGETWMAFFSNITGASGTFVRRIAPTAGPEVLAPGAVTNGSAVQPIERTSVVSRLGAPGVVVAYCGGYPTCRRALLWRVGSAKALVAGTSTDLEDVAVGRGPAGRVWAMWHDDAKNRIFAARTNAAGTQVGAAVAVAFPPGTSAVWNLAGDGSIDRLDLFAHVTTKSSLASWHTQVRPGLTLLAGGKKVITFSVRDAGAPIKGAKIVVAGKKLTTNAKGVAKIDLPKGVFTATATKAGYTKAVRKVVSL